MKISTISRPRINFTNNHEWIDINGTVGFVGISAYKLKEIKNITNIKWHVNKGIIEKGSLIAEIHTADQIIPVHAPVNCKFLGQNQKLAGNLNLIIESPQDKGWVFFVTPLKFNNQDTLLSPESYQKLIRVKVVS
ncbi:glycine cleavage system H protein [Chitinophaga niastensis]|uniref:Glycine cleavage system H protein n=1 Tax=Chitinophaga niastensis TaxID=536980 RepID=A0A2P8HHP7_CHINA|nr:glycine cleavage system protein H [Chitinophaga niastensis]PSL45727.1 glycine cleavage system H protein [Chitinophaga niastensis]